MKGISSVRAASFEVPFVTPFANSVVQYNRLEYVRTMVTCAGATGYGEVTAMPGYSSETVASIRAAIEQHFGPALVGMNPRHVLESEERLAKILPGNPYARSAIDLALTDLRARLMEMPAHAVMGGALHEVIPLGGIVTLSTPEKMATQARRWVKLGAASLQVKIASSIQDSVARVAAVRKAAGDAVLIAVDGNGSFDRLTALRTMDAIAGYRIEFFEQPLASDDIDGMAMLAAKGAIPVVADEMLVTAHDALRIVNAGAAHGFNLKLNKSGITETRRIQAIAAAGGIRCGLGSMLESNFGTHAQVHFAATLQQPLFAAELVGPWMVKDAVTGPEPKHGKVPMSWVLPKGIGWGVVPSNGA
jgi:L-alanine-DL-glutamate epimerase-like enolase superfamily enzyme